MRASPGDKKRLSEFLEEPLISREILPEEALNNFPEAIRTLRGELAKRADNYAQVPLRSLARQIAWWVDADGDLIGKGQHLAMLSPHWQPGDMHETVMMWDREGSRWIETQMSLGEVHVDNPDERIGSFGGAEPAPGDETGKDEPKPLGMTMESFRSMVRVLLEDIEDKEKSLSKDEELLSKWADADPVDRVLADVGLFPIPRGSKKSSRFAMGTKNDAREVLYNGKRSIARISVDPKEYNAFIRFMSFASKLSSQKHVPEVRTTFETMVPPDYRKPIYGVVMEPLVPVPPALDAYSIIPMNDDGGRARPLVEESGSAALLELYDFLCDLSDHGLSWQGLHRDNFLMRPSTGDMVIVDPGAFVRSKRKN